MIGAGGDRRSPGPGRLPMPRYAAAPTARCMAHRCVTSRADDPLMIRLKLHENQHVEGRDERRRRPRPVFSASASRRTIRCQRRRHGDEGGR